MAKEDKRHANTTEYRDHGAKDHDHKTEWSRDDQGRLAQKDTHVQKREGWSRHTEGRERERKVA